MSDYAIALGVNVPTGKDSLSMTQKYPDGQKVVAPGTVIVSAVGEVSNMFTASPGPDKETVIFCNVADMTSWMYKAVNISFKAGTSLREVAKSVSDALGYDTPYISPTVDGRTFSAPFCCNSSARDAIAKIKQNFSGVEIYADSNRLRVIHTSDAVQEVHQLKVLIQPPQISGGSVSLTAPYNPDVKPGDKMYFPVQYYQTNLIGDSAALKNKKTAAAAVVSVQFSLSTTRGNNEMHITGTLV